ncbi:MAG: hypothetical protein LUH03_06645 [Oscillospiraceae bacterium]|nr:hypothetical protein [Oscillospiraceae bacterium]
MKIPIVLICDDKFALPTGVAIRSLYENRDQTTNYHIYVLCDNVEEENRQRLTRLSRPGFQIDLMDVCEGEDFVTLQKKGLHVSTAALLKFYLPELFPQYSKMLYLDGDILILRDLLPLYEQPISDVYLAAVSDRQAFYYPSGVHFQQRLGRCRV